MMPYYKLFNKIKGPILHLKERAQEQGMWLRSRYIDRFAQLYRNCVYGVYCTAYNCMSKYGLYFVYIASILKYVGHEDVM